MSDQKIRITIDPVGNKKVEAEGFVGTSCEAATAHIEQALAGGKPNMGDREYKPEYSQSADVQAEQSW